MNVSDFPIGTKIVLKEFCFLGINGGTGMSNWQYDEKYEKPANFVVTKVWDDYECGVRGWCEPEETDADLIAYLERNAFKGSPENDTFTVGNIKFPEGKFTCFFSEFDLINETE
jgi:hypothetical protein